jgi:dolichyl-phosphate mannosyltransferase polypeptide 3
VIAYRVYSFNDCTEAAAELKQQIAEARADLKKKGLKF